MGEKERQRERETEIMAEDYLDQSTLPMQYKSHLA